jgi:hypothetical protein
MMQPQPPWQQQQLLLLPMPRAAPPRLPRADPG